MLVQAIVGISLAAWLVISALNQLPGRRLATLKLHDYFALIPAWSFFAPNPGTTDLHLFVRERVAGGGIGIWRELPVVPSPSLWQVLWNPEKRRNKAFTDMAVSILRLVPEHKEFKSLEISVCYIAILNYAMHAGRSVGSEAVQFMIVESFGNYTKREPEVVFLSEFHKR